MGHTLDSTTHKKLICKTFLVFCYLNIFKKCLKWYIKRFTFLFKSWVATASVLWTDAFSDNKEKPNIKLIGCHEFQEVKRVKRTLFVNSVSARLWCFLGSSYTLRVTWKMGPLIKCKQGIATVDAVDKLPYYYHCS